jgi:hypothetical protein
MGLASTQPLAEMTTTNFFVGKGLPARKADRLTAICPPPVTRIALPFLYVFQDSTVKILHGRYLRH